MCEQPRVIGLGAEQTASRGASFQSLLRKEWQCIGCPPLCGGNDGQTSQTQQMRGKGVSGGLLSKLTVLLCLNVHLLPSR